MDDRHRDVALFRYSLIREAADPALSKAARGRLVRGLAARDHTGPGGVRVRVARNQHAVVGDRTVGHVRGSRWSGRFEPIPRPRIRRPVALGHRPHR